uniref:Uncharacterized protein n=1 Tax=Pseudomonas phage HRDY3 TaxID=3236930 RepID=A0AB39CED9_9VIRU
MEEKESVAQVAEQMGQEEAKQKLAEALKEMAKRDPKQYKKIMAEMFPNTVLLDELHRPRLKANRKQRRMMKARGLVK